jgi:hypothetical protein
MTLKEESVIEMIAYKRPRRILRFSMIPIYNSENELSHWVSTERCYGREKSEKEKNI